MRGPSLNASSRPSRIIWLTRDGDTPDGMDARVDGHEHDASAVARLVAEGGLGQGNVVHGAMLNREFEPVDGHFGRLLRCFS